MHAVSSEKPDIGNIREPFFLNQSKVNHDVYSTPNADFQIEKYIFEVGDKSKKQIRNIALLFCPKNPDGNKI